MLAEAYTQGRKCGLIGSAFALNPFEHGTPKHEEWISGWRSGQVDTLSRYGDRAVLTAVLLLPFLAYLGVFA